MLGQTVLNLLLVQQLSGELEGKWQLFLKGLSVLLDLKSVAVLEFGEGLAVLLLGLKKIFIPLLVEFLVLLNVSLLALLPLLSLVEHQLLQSAVIVLLLKLGNSVLGHLGFNILALALAGLSVIFEHSAKISLVKRYFKQ